MTDRLGAFIVGALLRYFRSGASVPSSGGFVRRADRELLLLHWSVSPQVVGVAHYLREHPHEVRATLEARSTIGSGSIRGRLNATATMVLQTRTGDPSLFVCEESFRSHATGPNRVLAWTMTYAAHLARRFRQMLPEQASYRARAVSALRAVEGVSRTLPRLGTSLSPPSPDDVRSARASRSGLYRRAADAYDLLRALERLDEAAMSALLESTMIGPTERWRQFELALALGMADAAASKLDVAATLRTILPGASDVLIDVGPYAVRWQRAAPTYESPRLEHWEQRALETLRDYGIAPGYDRPDVVLFEKAMGRAVAVGEAKYFENDDWRDRLRDSVGQVIDYARGYENDQDVGNLLGRSVIALWNVGDDQVPTGTLSATPFVVTFPEFESGLSDWALRAL